jgi:hypothetical protein
MMFDTGLTLDQCKNTLETLQNAGKILYSEGWLSITNFQKHQNYEGWKVLKGIEKQMQLCPEAHRVFIGYHTPIIPLSIGYHTPTIEGKERKLKEKNLLHSGHTRATAFIKPTLEQVKAYAYAIGANINPQQFVDHYESNGWKVGKNPMKSWQAAVRTWKHNGINNQTATRATENASPFTAEELADVDRLVKQIPQATPAPEEHGDINSLVSRIGKRVNNGQKDTRSPAHTRNSTTR